MNQAEFNAYKNGIHNQASQMLSKIVGGKINSLQQAALILAQIVKDTERYRREDWVKLQLGMGTLPVGKKN